MIFNSLGSNYDYKFALKTFFASNNVKNKTHLISFLNTKYEGETTLLYKGREAIKLSIDLLNLEKGSKVGITGFTCYAVYKAVVDAKCTPVYLDIEKTTLNFNLDAVKKYKGLKVLIIQNTLGNPCDIVKIKKYCLQNKIILIEDLAHSIGSVYATGEEAGTYGDFVVLSFGQDKVVDAVSGGALIVRNVKYKNKVDSLIFKNVDVQKQLKDRFYPLFTFIIRSTYGIGLGKLLHFILKKLNILSQPIIQESAITLHSLPDWYCDLINFQFSQLENNLNHRRKILNVYVAMLSKRTTSFSLRFPILVKNKIELIKNLQEYGVYVSDIWYDAPIAPARFLTLTSYSNQCPIAESVSKQIVNLPTHCNISLRQAKELSVKVNKWLNTQHN